MHGDATTAALRPDPSSGEFRVGPELPARPRADHVDLLRGVVMVLMVVAAFVVDIGTTWMRRGELQQQADKAATFAAEALPAADDASRLLVARRAAYHHPSTIPAT